MHAIPDPKSIAGTELPLTERTEVLVIGAGPAGLAAACAAAGAGRSVILVDENPLGAETMGENLPLHFGGGMTGAVRNRRAMLETVAGAMPGLEDAFAAGVDVRLGTACWGLYAPGADVGWLPGPVAGLMDGDHCWMVGAEKIVVAAGRRDMGLAFRGWEKTGVMGITAALRLATLYDALGPRRVVVLGTGTETLQAALALQAQGTAILAVVEPGPAPLGPPAMVAALQAQGAELLLGHAPRRAESGAEGGDAVEALVLGAVDAEGRGLGGPELRIACDGVLLGVGSVPVVELLDAAGCRMVFDAARGGIVPVLDAAQATSKPGLYAAGDCAGLWPGKTLDIEIARAEGRRAVSATPEPMTAVPDGALGQDRLAWVRAAVLDAGEDTYVCQCEAVTAREILELRPPRYLGTEAATPGEGDPAARRNARDLRSLLGDRPHPDQVKRLTRAGMGTCQGRRCREQVAALLALASGQPYGAVAPASHRAPVRPMPLRLAAEAGAESAAMARHWDTWFGMPAQYVPFWEVPAQYTAATRPRDEDPCEKEGASE